jgi:hypothetical protein
MSAINDQIPTFEELRKTLTVPSFDFTKRPFVLSEVLRAYDELYHDSIEKYKQEFLEWTKDVRGRDYDFEVASQSLPVMICLFHFIAGKGYPVRIMKLPDENTYSVRILLSFVLQSEPISKSRVKAWYGFYVYLSPETSEEERHGWIMKIIDAQY